MRLTPQLWVLAVVNALYILGFGAYFIVKGNSEFVWYVVVMLALYLTVAFSIRRWRVPRTLLWALTLWGLMHVLGGGLMIGEHVLYAQHLFHIGSGEGELYVLKYDQLVHFYGFGITVFILYYIIGPHVREGANWETLYALLAAGSMGLGALNEVVEFVAVLFTSRNGVGGYFNTGLDLLFNMFGAAVAVLILRHMRNRGRLSLT